MIIIEIVKFLILLLGEDSFVTQFVSYILTFSLYHLVLLYICLKVFNESKSIAQAIHRWYGQSDIFTDQMVKPNIF